MRPYCEPVAACAPHGGPEPSSRRAELCLTPNPSFSHKKGA